MIELHIALLDDWDQLIQQLNHGMLTWELIVQHDHEVDCTMPFESTQAFVAYVDIWESAISKCPARLADIAQTAALGFLQPIPKPKSIKQEFEGYVCELPEDKMVFADGVCPSVWSVLSPTAVSRMYNMSSRFKIEEYASYFVFGLSSHYFELFDEVKEYTNSWLRFVTEAASHSCGLMIYEV